MLLKPARTVEVVDDYEPNRYALTRVLEKLGATVLPASDGAEALRRAREHPDVILLDVGLPDIDGYEVCRRLKSQPETCDIPVVFMSAVHMSQDSKTQGERAGGSDFLFQPIIIEDLLPVIEGAIAKAAARRKK